MVMGGCSGGGGWLLLLLNVHGFGLAFLAAKMRGTSLWIVSVCVCVISGCYAGAMCIISY